MSEHHFNYFRVKNFKRFKDLEVKNIGQFNLVLGDNNVGKTSLLEALMWEPSQREFGSFLPSIEESIFIKYLIKCFSFKNYGEMTSLVSYFLNIDEETGTCDFSCGEEKSEEQFELSTNQFKIRYKLNGGNVFDSSQVFRVIPEEDNKYMVLRRPDSSKDKYDLIFREVISSTIVPFLPFQRSYDEEITEFYLDNIQGNRALKRKYVKNLELLFPEIEDLEPSIEGKHKSLLINRSNSNFSIPLAYFGEGTIKTAKVLSYIIKFSERKLLLDEIDTGIHYSRMKDYWKVILQSAKENDVQIFATTHNRECIESYNQALIELGEEYQEKARTITLKESPRDQSITAYTNTIDVLDDALEMGNDLR